MYFRILRNEEMNLSLAEVERRMNLDESPCCPRRRKRKRRRVESNSEEEDETYIVEDEINGFPVQTGRKQMKKLPVRIKANGKVQPPVFIKVKAAPIPIRPRPSSFLTGSSKSMTNCESSSEGIVLPSPSMINSNTSLPSRYDSSVLQQPPLYHTTFMNSTGSNTYIRTPAKRNPVSRNRVILPGPPPPPIQSSTSYQLPPPPSVQSSTSYQQPQLLQSPQNTMVSIPTPTDNSGRSVYLLSKPRKVGLTLTPNIIDLDSDSDDEPRVVQQQNNSTVNGDDDMAVVDISLNKAVPVALTWENSDDDGIKEEQPLREMSSTLTKNVASFSETMLPYSQQLDKLLSDVKEKMHCFFDLNDAIQDVELIAQQKIKQFCWNMRSTVLQLANINDRIVREYNGWRRSRKTETQMQSLIDENELTSQENVEIPLDMTCVNDSDTESDYERSEYRIKKPSDLIKSGNIIENLLFSKKTVIHRGTGDDKVYLPVDKATQMYNIPRDYEKCISYSMLTKSNDDSKTDNTVLKQMSLQDKNFGKYEEQFITYLQHVEDRGSQTEESERNAESLEESDEIPFQELIETNSSFISHLFENTNSPDIISTDESKICEKGSEKSDLSDHINAMNDITDTLKSTIDNNDQKILNDSNSDIRIQQTKDIRIQGMILLDEKLQNTHDNETDGGTTSIMSNNEDPKSGIIASNTVNMEATTSKGNEDDCTIIDD